MSAAPETVEIAILALADATASTVYGMQDLLSSPGRDWSLVTTGVAGTPLISPTIVSADGGFMQLANGAWVKPARKLDDDYHPAAVCVLELSFDPQRGLSSPYSREIAWLQRYWARGGIVTAACTGALLLGEAGLLKDQDATAHWGIIGLMSQRYPGVRLHPNRVLVASGEGQRLIMAGGGTSWLELGLYLVSRFCGSEEAVRVAKLHLIEWHDSGQQPFASICHSGQVADAVVANAQAWAAHHYDQQSPVAMMVELSGLPERSFKRRFKSATGMTPMDYVLTLRVEEAKQILETSDACIEAVAEMVGYQDAAFFSRKFRQQVGLTLSQYRRKFGGLVRFSKARHTVA